MKRFLFATAVLTALLGLPLVHADDSHHPEGQAAAPGADQMIQKMQANTRKMQEQLDKLAKTKDPKTRQQLLAEHMQTMRENAGMADAMMGGGCPGMGMMGGGQGGMGMGGMGMMGMMGGGQGGMGPEAMMDRLRMMERRMDMMQMMMEQMSRGQAGPMPSK